METDNGKELLLGLSLNKFRKYKEGWNRGRVEIIIIKRGYRFDLLTYDREKRT